MQRTLIKKKIIIRPRATEVPNRDAKKLLRNILVDFNNR